MASRRRSLGCIAVLALTMSGGCSLVGWECFEGECETATSNSGSGGGAAATSTVAQSGVGPTASASSTSGTGGAGGQMPEAWCPQGMLCIDVPTLPFHDDSHNTAVHGSALWNSYGVPCDPLADESGNEIVYRLHLPPTPVVLFPKLSGMDRMNPDAPYDMDLQLLTALDPNTCFARSDHDFDVEGGVAASGVIYVVVDTYVEGGVVQSGPYTLDIPAY